jgi:hypothetical protein
LCVGHASVGFTFLAGWFLYRRSRPALGRSSLALGLGLGLVMGLGRMAAGAHFLSDILWSGAATYGAAWLSYHLLLRIPQREAAARAQSQPPPVTAPTPAAGAAFALSGVVLFFGLLYLYPLRAELVFPAPGVNPVSRLDLDLDRADLEIRPAPSAGPAFHLGGQIRAWGLPVHRFTAEGGPLAGHPTGWRERLRVEGLFSRIDSRLLLELDPARLRELVVRVGRGDIRVAAGLDLRLDLATAQGQVLPFTPAETSAPSSPVPKP